MKKIHTKNVREFSFMYTKAYKLIHDGVGISEVRTYTLLWAVQCMCIQLCDLHLKEQDMKDVLRYIAEPRRANGGREQWVKRMIDRWIYLAIRMEHVLLGLSMLVNAHTAEYPGPVCRQREKTAHALKDFEKYLDEWAYVMHAASMWQRM